MNFYYFGGHIQPSKIKQNNSNFNNKVQKNQIELLEDNNFLSVLFTYNPLQGDFFTKLARDIDFEKKIKYMIAIRSHTLSPQYLCMINKAINDIMPNRLQINLISGHIKENEKSFGGLIGDINDLSSNIDRSNYLIKYLEELNEMSKNKDIQIPDIYVTTTNKYVYEAANKFNNKMIIHYTDYINGYWTERKDGIVYRGDKINLENKKIIVSITPVLRNTQEEIDKEFPIQDIVTPQGQIVNGRPNMFSDDKYFTFDQFKDLIKKLESEGINEIMLNGSSELERSIIIDFVGKYTESNS